MAMTMTQKILAAHAGLGFVTAGALIEAELDLAPGNDTTALHRFPKRHEYRCLCD